MSFSNNDDAMYMLIVPTWICIWCPWDFAPHMLIDMLIRAMRRLCKSSFSFRRKGPSATQSYCSPGVSEGSGRSHTSSPTHCMGIGDLTRVLCACLRHVCLLGQSILMHLLQFQIRAVITNSFKMQKSDCVHWLKQPPINPQHRQNLK